MKHRRRSPQRQWLVQTLRRSIVEGELAGGERLPPRVSLCARLGVSPVTLQGAIDELVGDGFLEAMVGRGTYVVPYPPHCCRRVILMPGNAGLNPEDVGLLEERLAVVARAMSRPDCRLAVYDQVTPHRDNPGYRRAVADIERHRTGGLLHVYQPWPLAHTPLVRTPAVPKAIIGSPTCMDDIPTVACDWKSFVSRGIGCLAGQGCQRLAVVTSLPTPEAEEQLLAAVAASGLCLARHALLVFQATTDSRRLRGLGSALYWLFQQPREQRPDAILVTDDVYLPTVMRALSEQSLALRSDLHVVVHANFPLASEPFPGVRRLGYSVPGLLRAGLDLIARQQQGEPVPAVTRAEAVFAEEFSTQYSQSHDKLKEPCHDD